MGLDGHLVAYVRWKPHGEVPLILWTPLRHNQPKEVSDEYAAKGVHLGVQSRSRRTGPADRPERQSDRRQFQARQEAQTAIFSCIEGFYNRRRRHSTLGYRCPLEFEQEATLVMEGVH